MKHSIKLFGLLATIATVMAVTVTSSASGWFLHMPVTPKSLS